MVLIDTNIAVSLCIQNDWTDAAQRLLALDPEWRTEPYALVELTNVLTTYLRAGYLTESEAERGLEEAEALLTPGLFAVSHRQTLSAAIQFRISAYDARFIAAALSLGMKLITEDTRLRAAVPALTQSLADALAA